MNIQEYDKLNPGERHLVDWQINISGHFYTSLFNIFAISDWQNLNKLKLGFPEEVEAFGKYRTESGWWPSIKKRLEI